MVERGAHRIQLTASSQNTNGECSNKSCSETGHAHTVCPSNSHIETALRLQLIVYSICELEDDIYLIHNRNKIDTFILNVHNNDNVKIQANDGFKV